MVDERGRTLDFVRSKFGEYYEKCELQLPVRFGEREFGFIFFESGMMQRHIGFKKEDDVRRFLVNRTPMHVYHSSAYYEIPNAPTMDEKNWLGADLIFDLDSDHLKGAKEMSYEVMLAEVKKEFIKLIDSYILEDLGISKKHMTIVFSGARGYHLHVRDPRVLGLGSPERREIVDYLSPGSEDVEELAFEKTAYDKRESRFGISMKYVRKMPRMTDHGWKKKMRIGVENLLRELEEMGKDKAVEYLEGFGGIGGTISNGIWKDLFEGKVKGAERMLAEDKVEVFSSDKYRDAFIRVVVESQKVKLEGEADEPVTSDVKRLIRLPSSLHGKTGLLVKRLDFEELEGFEPLRDAIPANFGSDQVTVKVKEAIKFDIGGESFNLGSGISKLPEYAAIFLMCRGVAALER
jgi:DNA primase small subunit